LAGKYDENLNFLSKKATAKVPKKRMAEKKKTSGMNSHPSPSKDPPNL